MNGIVREKKPIQSGGDLLAASLSVVPGENAIIRGEVEEPVVLDEILQ